MIVIGDGSEYCEIEGQKVDRKVDSPIELGKRTAQRESCKAQRKGKRNSCR